MAAADHPARPALNLMRRMPPAFVENSLAGLLELVPQLTDDLLANVDQPLKVEKDSSGREFVKCDYNRDGDSYRSPWNNQYTPAAEDVLYPPKRLRDMEVAANAVFEVYRKLYFEGGISSVYFFETNQNDPECFGASFLIHKDVEAGKAIDKGFWDSVHVFDVSPDKEKKGFFTYKLTTTVMVSMGMANKDAGDIDLSGNMTRQETQSLACTKEKPHLMQMGGMLEDMELRIRNTIEGVYIQKTREVVNGIRAVGGLSGDQQKSDLASSLAAAVSAGPRKSKE